MPISPIEGVNMMLHSITSPAALVPLAYIGIVVGPVEPSSGDRHLRTAAQRRVEPKLQAAAGGGGEAAKQHAQAPRARR